jgi:hypothetical protein
MTQIIQENFDYAVELLIQCVLADLANAKYVQTYIETLHKKYRNNRKGATFARFRERAARAALRKAEQEEDNNAVLRNGVKLLAMNPWDVPILQSLAVASRNSGDFDCELLYLKCVVDAAPKNPDTCTRLAQALRERLNRDKG